MDDPTIAEHITDEALLSVMDIGDQAEKFIGSELGQVMLSCAREEARAAMDKLKDCSPFDSKAIREHQAAIWRSESFEGWLRDLVVRGREAYNTYRERKGDS